MIIQHQTAAINIHPHAAAVLRLSISYKFCKQDRMSKSKILIFGGTGYLGTYLVKASASAGHPTFVYVRPVKPQHDSNKLNLLEEFQSMGVTIFQVYRDACR